MVKNCAGNDVLLVTDNLECISRLRQDLRKARYPGDSIQEVLGTAAGSKHSRRDLPLFVRRLSQHTPINTLVKLFALQVPVTEAEAHLAFESLGSMALSHWVWLNAWKEEFGQRLVFPAMTDCS